MLEARTWQRLGRQRRAVVSVAAGSVADGADAEDLRLLRAGETGDRDALAALLERHEASIYRVCRGVLGNPADAEDAAQETLLRVLRALARPGGFRGDSSVRTYLHRIALNVCLDWKRQSKPALSLEDAFGGTGGERGGPSQPGPEKGTVDRLRLRDALSRLLPRQRALLLLREQEEWSVPEIAAMLGWKVKKVEYELFKARKTLAAWRAEDAETWAREGGKR